MSIQCKQPDPFLIYDGRWFIYLFIYKKYNYL